MPVLEHQVELRIASGEGRGEVLDVWDEFALTEDMLSPGSAWTFGLWYSDHPSSTWRRIRRLVRLGTIVQVWIDGALRTQGRVEEARPKGDRNGGLIYVVSGRDMAASAIDSHANTSIQLRSSTVVDAIERLFAPLGIPVIVGASAEAAREQQTHNRRRGPRGTAHHGRRHRRRHHRKVVDHMKVRPGETVWNVARQLAQQAGCLIWSVATDEGLGVVIDAPAYDSEPLFKFEQRIAPSGEVFGNVLEHEHTFSIRNIPTTLRVHAHAAVASGEDARVQNALTNDYVLSSPLVEPGIAAWCVRYPEDERARSGANVTRRAERQFAEANREFRRYTYTTQGFGQGAKLYAVNTMATVRDETEEPIVDEPMLITRISFRGSRSAGEKTQVSLSPRGAIQVFPELL